MSLSLLKKTALLMGDFEQPGTHKKTAAKTINKVKLVKLSSKEQKTRELVEGIRKNRQKDHVKTNLETILRFSNKMDNYAKKTLSNDLVRQRLLKRGDFVPLDDADKQEETSAFTDEDFKRFEEEYNIQFTKRAKERNMFRKMLN